MKNNNFNSYCITEEQICQDTPEKELKERFVPKKNLSLHLSESYERLGFYDKAFKVKHCGDLLDFVKTSDSDSETSFKLHNANFCRDRLCPMCSWRRSYKIFSQVSQIMNVICPHYEFIFLTLTVPNCSASDLPHVIERMQKAWTYGIRRNKAFKSSIKGYFKALEVTHNLRPGSKSFDTYHPHFHCILAVGKRYFKDSQYIKRDEWLEMWQKAYKDNSITQVDVRRCKSKEDIKQGEKAVKALSSAVAEVAKYTVKASSYIGKLDKAGNLVHKYSDKVIDSSVVALMTSLAGRRLCDFGGVFKDTLSQLQLDDCEDGDLIHVDGQLRSDVALQIYRYRWSCGSYKLISVEFSDSSLIIDPDTGEVLG